MTSQYTVNIGNFASVLPIECWSGIDPLILKRPINLAVDHRAVGEVHGLEVGTLLHVHRFAT